MMVFEFIQSSMPIIDKKAIKRDRHDMIKCWALNSIPVEAMFWAFTQVFNLKREMFKKTKDKSRRGVKDNFWNGFGNITDVKSGPDGFLYVLDFDKDRIFRIRPVG